MKKFQCFIFVHKTLIFKDFKRWNIAFQCFIYVSSMFHFIFRCFIFRFFGTNSKLQGKKFKTCSKKNQNLLEAISKHARRDATETLKLRLKHPHAMFQSRNLLIINGFKPQTETWIKINPPRFVLRTRARTLYKFIQVVDFINCNLSKRIGMNIKARFALS